MKIEYEVRQNQKLSPMQAKRALSLYVKARFLFPEGGSFTITMVVFFSDYRFAMLRLIFLLFSTCSTKFVEGFIKLLDILLFFACGIFGRSGIGFFSTCSYFFSSSSLFQLFFFLKGEGLASLIFLSALNLFYPLKDLFILSSYPTIIFCSSKNSVKEVDFFFGLDD